MARRDGVESSKLRGREGQESQIQSFAAGLRFSRHSSRWPTTFEVRTHPKDRDVCATRAIGRDGKITQQKAQALVDAAHSAKYKEAADLLKYAYAQFQSGRRETASDQATPSVHT